MGTPREPKPAKYFVALLSSEIDLLAAVERDLTTALRALDGSSETLPWTASNFYEKELGRGLLRRFVSLAALASPQELAVAKLKTQTIEASYRSESTAGRRINLDPGYLDRHKVVLASTKDAGQRIYLGAGIYGEVTLIYHNSDFHGLPYTYPDYLWPETLAFFANMRAVYLKQLRQLG